MDPHAIEKAKRRLLKAERCFAEIKKPPRTYGDFVDVWSDFLLALNSVYSCLEQGSKSNPHSRQWFGGKKNERRTDPLLQYVHQARNSDEHGIAPISRFQKPTAGIVEGSGDPGKIKKITTYDDKVVIDLNDTGGKIPAIKIMTPAAYLISVTDSRFGTTFDPPTEHLGEPLLNNHPLTVSELALTYFQALVAEAEALIPKGGP